MQVYQTIKHKRFFKFIDTSFVFLLGLMLSVSTLTAQAPSSIIPDISEFKIQYPIDENGIDYTGVAWEDRDNPHIRSENITNLSGYVAPASYIDYFFVDGNEVVFKAHCAGALTSPNAYPRTELRERPGGIDGFWNFADEQELNATFRVTHLPDLKQEVCMLQIKGNTTPSTSNTSETLRLEYRANSGQGLHLVVNENTTLNDIMDYSLGETIDARLYVNNGDVTVELTNVSTGDTYLNQYASAYDWGYFKAGAYTQSSIWQEKNGVGDELPTAYGEVRFSSLELGVQDICTPAIPANRAAINEDINSVTLNWDYDADIDHYNVRYRPAGSTDWSFAYSLRLGEGDFTLSGSSVVFDLGGLVEDTEYEWQVRAKCADGSGSNYNDGSGPNFTTLLVVLPVELISFDGTFEERNNRIALTWQTAAEINNKGFRIERSLDPNVGFEEIGWVDGKLNTNILSSYNFNDKTIEEGKRYYYRLEQVDIGGQTEFSEIITIQTPGSDKGWSVFPNPFFDVVTISSKGVNENVGGIIQIVDVTGKIVFEETYLLEREENLELSLGHLAPGVYSLLISDEKGQILSTKPMVRK